MKIICAVIVICAALFSSGKCFSGEAPKFTLPDIEGKNVKLNAVIGKKVIVLNFWASWCSACKEEIPQLKILQASPGAGNVVFLGINVGESKNETKRFIEKYDYPYRVLTDTDRKIAGKYGLIRLPTTVVIGKDGKIVFSGPNPPQDLMFKHAD